jgi:hypothetical protein
MFGLFKRRFDELTAYSDEIGQVFRKYSDKVPRIFGQLSERSDAREEGIKGCPN